MMALKRQRATGLDHNAFDLVAMASIDGLVPAPRSVDLIMIDRVHVARGTELTHAPLSDSVFSFEATRTASSVDTTTTSFKPTRALQPLSL